MAVAVSREGDGQGIGRMRIQSLAVMLTPFYYVDDLWFFVMDAGEQSIHRGGS